MKTIYVNTQDFTISMTPKEGHDAFTTSIFDTLTDNAIEQHFYVPQGYTYHNDITGEDYTGEFVRPLSDMSVDRNSAAIEKKITDNTAAINDIMEAIVELASLLEGAENG